MVGILEDDERPEEVVPHPLKGQDRDRGERRAGEWKHHAPVSLEVPGAVELRSLFEVLRNRQEVLSHQEEVRRQNSVDQDEPLIRPDQVVVHRREVEVPRRMWEVAEDLKDRNEAKLIGNHERREYEHEQHLPSRKAQTRERIAAERAEEEVEQRDRGGHERAVSGVAGEVELGQHLPVGLERRVVGNKVETLDALGNRLQRGRDTPEERDEVQKGKAQEQRVDQEPRCPVAGAAARDLTDRTPGSRILSPGKLLDRGHMRRGLLVHGHQEISARPKSSRWTSVKTKMTRNNTTPIVAA